MPMKLPRQFYAPLAIGAPAPLRELPVRLERMIHFVPPHIEKVRAKVPELLRQVDVVLGNLEDAVPVDAKKAARDGFIAMARATDFGSTGLWTRINALNSPWALDDVTEIVAATGSKLDVIMLPKVDGPWDIHYLDQLLAQLEARYQLKKPIMIHAILETAQGVNNVEAIATASPRMHGMSLGPADLAASRAMKTTRVGGGHPDYKVLADAQGDAPRASSQQDLWHYTIAKMVDACAAAGIKPFYGPFGDFADPAGCETQFRNAFLMGCVGAWSLHPSQIDIAKNVFSPDPAEVAFAQKIVAAMPDGAGAVMIDGKMQDDATWKQAKVLLDLAKLVAAKDPDTACIRSAASSSTSIRYSTIPRNGCSRFPPRSGRTRISPSITCSPKTRKPNISPTYQNRTCCLIHQASRSGTPTLPRSSSATKAARTVRAIRRFINSSAQTKKKARPRAAPLIARA
jgi:malyl-CoA/(S)-citramalyl-CoA lyase